MTVAEQIKRSTAPFSIERGVEAATQCVKWSIDEYDTVFVGHYQFVDGSKLTYRGYLEYTGP